MSYPSDYECSDYSSDDEYSYDEESPITFLILQLPEEEREKCGLLLDDDDFQDYSSSSFLSKIDVAGFKRVMENQT